MNIYLRNISICAMVLSVSAAQAYRFVYRNHLDVPVTVSMLFVAKGYDTQVAPAHGEVVFEYKLGSWYAGFCFDANSLRLTKAGGQEIEAPVLFLRRETYDRVMSEVKQNTSGRTTQPFGNIPNRFGSICESVEFDIVADPNGNPRAIIARGWMV